jgi:hypothetical protein
MGDSQIGRRKKKIYIYTDIAQFSMNSILYRAIYSKHIQYFYFDLACVAHKEKYDNSVVAVVAATLLEAEKRHDVAQFLATPSQTTCSEVFTAVTMKNAVFWVVTPCGSCMNRRFGGSYSPHKQLAVTHSVHRLLVTTYVVPSSSILVTLMMEVLGTSESSVLTRVTRRNI